MSAADIRKLRKKFIVIAMLSVFIVMLFLGTTINLISYSIALNAINGTLNKLIEQDGPKSQAMGASPSISDIFSPEYNHNHYLVVTFDKEGNEVRVSKNSDGDEETEIMKNYAESALAGRIDFGRKGNYYFRKKADDNGTVIALLDSSIEIYAVYRLLLLTTGICVFGLIVTFVLVYRFSDKAIQPEIENNKRQKEFITNASHELKTPLAVIRANTELIEMMGGESEWTKSTLSQVDRMDGLIRNLVLIAKSQEKEQETVSEKADLSAAVEQTVDTYTALAVQTEKTLTKKIEKDVSLLIEEAKVRQLATILLDNAMKYCDEKGTIEVQFSATKRNGVLLTVSNTYAAGATVDYTRFFDRFYREDKSRNIDRGGYGIGLSIAESICKQYSGSIEAQWQGGVISFICHLYQ